MGEPRSMVVQLVCQALTACLSPGPARAATCLARASGVSLAAAYAVVR